jgi:hypothetical protein
MLGASGKLDAKSWSVNQACIIIPSRMPPLIIIRYRPLIQVEVTGRCLAVLFMDELQNLTNVVTGQLDKLIHKQNWCQDLDHHQKKVT